MYNSFGKDIIPNNEEERLKALYAYNVVGSEPEVFFNNLAHLIAECYNTPIALISLVDREQVFFKANVGMKDTNRVARGVSLCSLAILDSNPTIFEDTLSEPCLLANPLVAGSFGLRFYAGAPIITPDGFNIGTVCIVDKKPRNFSPMDKELLSRFADSVMEALIERRKGGNQNETFKN